VSCGRYLRLTMSKLRAECGEFQEHRVRQTTGEVFENGSLIEPVRDDTCADRLLLLYCDGGKISVAPRLELNGQKFEPAAVDPMVLRAMSLPAKSEPCGSVRELLEGVARDLKVYAALEDPFARLVGRFVLSTHIVGALPIATSLRIIGSDTLAGSQLWQILGGLCRRAIRLTEVTSSGICALPLEWNPTLLIHQREIDSRLLRLFAAARSPNEFIPRGRRLLNLYCPIATFLEIGSVNGHKFEGIEIPAPPPHRRVEILTEESLRRLTEEYQAKLLHYRFDNFMAARRSTFDARQFLSPMRDLARSLGACTPGETELQTELLGFLEARDAESRSAKWTDPAVVVLEALLGFVHEGEETSLYVGEIAKAVEAILRGRGEMREVEAREVGEILRNSLKFKTEARDARGFKLVLTQEVCRRVHELARDFDAPSIAQPLEGCRYCAGFGEERKDLENASE
jgi:hypothetical protein